MPRQPCAASEGWAAPPRRPRRRVSVSLTPLIDVVFILLVFFMLASSFLDWRTLRLDAAEAGAGAAVEGSVLVGVSASGLAFAGRPIEAVALRERIAALMAENPARRVALRPAPGTPLQATVDALDLLAAAGARDVALSVPGAAPLAAGG
ncbi:outer membrane transport energization protein ExbD [Rubrimonas cliftonensis]|uniref:Outer membrane transport energization protein ExbD n=1 Tax=Rubrimonas cliftonensis TaxID=89524 RepID=A0A1H4EZC7_9RHOB|nr:outer membrane transport energization protein ExbD [Rubrimonas cliftonensis]